MALFRRGISVLLSSLYDLRVEDVQSKGHCCMQWPFLSTGDFCAPVKSVRPGHDLRVDGVRSKGHCCMQCPFLSMRDFCALVKPHHVKACKARQVVCSGLCRQGHQGIPCPLSSLATYQRSPKLRGYLGIWASLHRPAAGHSLTEAELSG